MSSTFAPGWVDELAKSQVKAGEVKKLNTDPEDWAAMRQYGKKPVRWNTKGYASRGGQKTAKAKRGTKKWKPVE